MTLPADPRFTQNQVKLAKFSIELSFFPLPRLLLPPLLPSLFVFSSVSLFLLCIPVCSSFYCFPLPPALPPSTHAISLRCTSYPFLISLPCSPSPTPIISLLPFLPLPPPPPSSLTFLLSLPLPPSRPPCRPLPLTNTAHSCSVKHLIQC